MGAGTSTNAVFQLENEIAKIKEEFHEAERLEWKGESETISQELERFRAREAQLLSEVEQLRA